MQGANRQISEHPGFQGTFQNTVPDRAVQIVVQNGTERSMVKAVTVSRLHQRVGVRLAGSWLRLVCNVVFGNRDSEKCICFKVVPFQSPHGMIRKPSLRLSVEPEIIGEFFTFYVASPPTWPKKGVQ